MNTQQGAFRISTRVCFYPNFFRKTLVTIERNDLFIFIMASHLRKSPIWIFTSYITMRVCAQQRAKHPIKFEDHNLVFEDFSGSDCETEVLDWTKQIQWFVIGCDWMNAITITVKLVTLLLLPVKNNINAMVQQFWKLAFSRSFWELD